VKENRRILNKLLVPTFGADLQVKKLTGPRSPHTNVSGH
jgi:hypothetical protein